MPVSQSRLAIRSGQIVALWLSASVSRLLFSAEAQILPVPLEKFLPQLDAALSTRDESQIAVLADVETWRRVGNPDLTLLSMVPLPPGPLTREEDRSQIPASIQYTALYTDGVKHEWSITLRFDTLAKKWFATVRAHACPSRGIVSTPRISQVQQASFPIKTWTILECRKLPQ
jgi:hypothetical protein